MSIEEKIQITLGANDELVLLSDALKAIGDAEKLQADACAEAVNEYIISIEDMGFFIQKYVKKGIQEAIKGAHKMNRDELKPCPFCGGEAVRGMLSVWCSKCGVETEKDGDATKEELIEKWNTRSNQRSTEDE